MAFKTRDLSVLAYANGFTLWHYTTGDAAPALTAPGYFDPAADMLRPGDMILANARAEAGERPGERAAAGAAGIFLVASGRGGAIALAPLAVA